MQIILGTILASKTGTELSIKHSERNRFNDISLCFYGDGDSNDYIVRLKNAFENVETINSFLHDLLVKRCKAIFLLESPPYGFQLNNGVFYLNKNFLKNDESSQVAILLLQLLYQCRVYEKLGINNGRSIWNRTLRDNVNNRIMKPAWRMYEEEINLIK